MIDPKDLGIPIWVGIGTDLWRPEYNIVASAGVVCVMIVADAVHSVVDTKFLRGKYGVVGNLNRIPFFICKKTGIIAVKAFSKESAKKMDAEFKDKILEVK